MANFHLSWGKIKDKWGYLLIRCFLGCIIMMSELTYYTGHVENAVSLNLCHSSNHLSYTAAVTVLSEPFQQLPAVALVRINLLHENLRDLSRDWQHPFLQRVDLSSFFQISYSCRNNTEAILSLQVLFWNVTKHKHLPVALKIERKYFQHLDALLVMGMERKIQKTQKCQKK